ncbi:threonine aldolase family protein [Collinsella tanakaei]|uniref:threonine aldolase family protein n=1 Tax=Collinsella tanakaei TaxID=626935 RepID=UPI001F1D40C8|nr:threonine aldolase family protein [Collinsella tanakaei]MCF2621435.1 threonine aldolase family protein [Collinsella tanakaei]MDM8302700.1 threonine aldolase family protein [Collinsella tanakaei]
MIDLRSDTLTKPTPHMLQTILTASLGDDDRTHELGRGEDPTVNELEDLAARITGKQAAVLVPSGCMANTAAVLAQVKPGSTLLVDEQQHLLLSEKYLFDPDFGRMQLKTYRHDEHGQPNLDDIAAALDAGGVDLICVENSHNYAGGAVVTCDRLAAVHELAQAHGVPVHMDGARLFNAATALGVPAADICVHVDSLMFCLSKGLGAPVGSVICSDQETILAARRIRKALGGAMRQAGIIAAPGIYALRHHVERLQEDHDNARAFADAIAGLACTRIVGDVVTNIVVVDVSGITDDPLAYCERAAEHGLIIRPVMKRYIRFVFYLGITHDDALEAARIVRELESAFAR